MTNNEAIKILTDIKKLINTMDREHVEKLFRIIIGEPEKNNESIIYATTFFGLLDLRKFVKHLISECIDAPHTVDRLTHKQMKQIYEVAGDYNYYPVCQLCGKPIVIDSNSKKHTKASNPMAFSWDHIFPRSLGGTTDLRNLQPAHKFCNNLKGSNIPEEQHVHYDISININMKLGCPECLECSEKQKRKKIRQALRKQDSWCHKQRSQRRR